MASVYQYYLCDKADQSVRRPKVDITEGGSAGHGSALFWWQSSHTGGKHQAADTLARPASGLDKQTPCSLEGWGQYIPGAQGAAPEPLPGEPPAFSLMDAPPDASYAAGLICALTHLHLLLRSGSLPASDDNSGQP